MAMTEGGIVPSLISERIRFFILNVQVINPDLLGMNELRYLFHVKISKETPRARLALPHAVWEQDSVLNTYF